MDRFALELLRAWSRLYAVDGNVRVVLPRSAVEVDRGRVGLPVDTIGRFKGHAWEQIDLRMHCANEMLINLCNTGPIFHQSQLVVIHDAGVMATPLSYTWRFRTWQRLLSAQLMQRARTVATVSKFSASELMRYFPSTRKKLEIIYESGEHILNVAADDEILTRLALVGQPYVLAVGSRSANKNFSAVVRAAPLLADLNTKIVAVGATNSRIFAGDNLDTANLVLAGYVTDGELRALYQNAQCFVFPSFYEGFGLPPLEAMHCGCPTIVSRQSAMPEICGPASLYFNPYDPADLAGQVRRLLSSRELMVEMREAGLIRANRFSWNNAATQLQALLYATN